MEQANRNIPEGSASDAFEIEKEAESSSDDSSDEEDSEAVVEDVDVKQKKKEDFGEGDEEKVSHSPCYSLDFSMNPFRTRRHGLRSTWTCSWNRAVQLTDETSVYSKSTLFRPLFKLKMSSESRKRRRRSR